MCTCLIRMCDVTHSDVWHDPYIWWRHRVENAELLITAATFGHAVEVVGKFERRRLGSM